MSLVGRNWHCEDCILGKKKELAFIQVKEPQRKRDLSLSTFMFGGQRLSLPLVGNNTLWLL